MIIQGDEKPVRVPRRGDVVYGQKINHRTTPNNGMVGKVVRVLKSGTLHVVFRETKSNFEQLCDPTHKPMMLWKEPRRRRVFPRDLVDEGTRWRMDYPVYGCNFVASNKLTK